MKSGNKHLEETKIKMSIAHKGKKYPNRKKYFPTIEHKKKISQKMRNRKITWGNKISKGKKGKKQLWAKNNPQIFKKGHITWNKGKKGLVKMSLETREKMRKSSKKGKESHFWKNGITLLYHKIRSCFEFRQWRSDIFTKDNYICQNCGENGYLHAHHIKKFSNIIKEYKIKTFEEALNCEELWDINNGITLCRECHKIKHNLNSK